MAFIDPCFGIGHNLSLICQMTSEDIKHQLIIISAIDISGIYNAGWGEGKGGGLVITLVGHCERFHFNPKQPSERKRSLRASMKVCVAVTVGGWAQS